MSNDEPKTSEGVYSAFKGLPIYDQGDTGNDWAYSNARAVELTRSIEMNEVDTIKPVTNWKEVPIDPVPLSEGNRKARRAKQAKMRRTVKKLVKAGKIGKRVP